jgi:hypothetical protein
MDKINADLIKLREILPPEFGKDETISRFKVQGSRFKVIGA